MSYYSSSPPFFALCKHDVLVVNKEKREGTGEREDLSEEEKPQTAFDIRVHHNRCRRCKMKLNNASIHMFFMGLTSDSFSS